MEIRSIQEADIAPCSSVQPIAIAVNGNKNSKSAVKWALERFIPEGRLLFKLLHVHPKITVVPTPMGNFVPISNVRDDVATAYRKEIEWQTNAMLLPYKKLCIQKQVEAEAVVIEADDVAAAISEEVTKFSITTLVIGASSRNVFTRKIRGRDMTSRVSACLPTFCTVYVISKGRLSSVQPSTSEVNDTKNGETNDCVSSEASYTSSSQTDGSETSSSTNGSYIRSSSLPVQRYQALLTLNHAIINRKNPADDPHHHQHLSLTTDEEVMCSNASSLEQKCDMSYTSSFRSTHTDNSSWFSGQASTSDNAGDSSLIGSQGDLNFELERLRIELRHFRDMYARASEEAKEASKQVDDLSRKKIEEAERLQEIRIREQRMRELVRQEKERNESAKLDVDFVRECIEREASQRRGAEFQAARDAEEKQRLERSLLCIDQKYKTFQWEEILSATSSFSDSLKIGMGAYGMVYKCNLNHVTAAVKVLHSNSGNISKQFQQELEILSRIRHPHLLLLLGACPDHGCLVYEYMENGSLEDRLLRKNNTPPIPWFTRFRISWEIGSALAFLHNTRPTPIVHRDLKPSNILLNGNLVSKIGDVGLSTLLPTTNSSLTVAYKDTAPVGTLCYIDPEYQRSGLVSPKSDLYAFGIVLLQLLTAKPPMALAHIVESALEEGKLVDILDQEAGQWPLEETQELAVLGLHCSQLRRVDRPDLETEVLPILEKLKAVAEKSRNPDPGTQLVPQGHFICPILQDVMIDPCVAADGYTYERSAIEIWFSMNDKSPMTNTPLPHKHLVPNYTLLSAITQWKSKNPRLSLLQ